MATVEEKRQLDKLAEDVQSLQFDSERVIKPALVDIKRIISEGIYITQKEAEPFVTLMNQLDKRTRNYALVEKIVFGLVGLILLGVAGALIGLVIVKGGN